MDKIPFLDLKAQYNHLRDEINPAIQEVLNSASFAGGPYVKRFEEEFATFCHCAEAVGVGNGTDALWLALLATVVAFWKVRPLAGALLVPYLAWVTFASALNFAICRLNR